MVLFVFQLPRLLHKKVSNSKEAWQLLLRIGVCSSDGPQQA